MLRWRKERKELVDEQNKAEEQLTRAEEQQDAIAQAAKNGTKYRSTIPFDEALHRALRGI